MSGSGKRVRNFINFLFLIAVVGLAAIAFKGLPNTPLTTDGTASPDETPSLRIETSPSASSTSTSPTTSVDELVVLESARSVNKLVSINTTTKVRTTLYTDADETVKIKQVGNITADGSQALVLMGDPAQDFGGGLYTIALDGSGTKALLIEQFASPWPPVYSPDGTKIAYVFFSNAERDAGFFLVIANRDGSNKRELVRETQAITQPVFSPDGSEIGYFRTGSESGSGSIMAVKVGGGEPRQLATYTSQVPYDLAWGKDTVLAYVDGTDDAANLFEIPTGEKSPRKLTTPTGAESRPVYHPAGTQIAFGSSAGGSSSVILYVRESGDSTNLGTGSVVLGWREGRGE